MAACRQWRGRAFAGDARLDRFEQGRSSGRHAAADDDPLDAEGQDERSDRSGEVVGHSVGDLDRDLIAGRTGAEDICGIRMRRQDGAATCSQRLVGLASDRRAGGDRLEATAQAARADGSVGIGHDVAHFAGEAVVATKQFPVEDDAGRDAGPDRQEGDARRRFSRPVGRLLAQPDRGRASVVLDEGRDAQLRLQHRPQRQVGDAQVDGHADRSVVRVDEARDGDADRGDVLPELAPGVVDETGNLADQR